MLSQEKKIQTSTLSKKTFKFTFNTTGLRKSDKTSSHTYCLLMYTLILDYNEM